MFPWIYFWIFVLIQDGFLRHVNKLSMSNKKNNLSSILKQRLLRKEKRKDRTGRKGSGRDWSALYVYIYWLMPWSRFIKFPISLYSAAQIKLKISYNLCPSWWWYFLNRHRAGRLLKFVLYEQKYIISSNFSLNVSRD